MGFQTTPATLRESGLKRFLQGGLITVCLLFAFISKTDAAGGAVTVIDPSNDAGSVTNVPPGLTDIVAVAAGLDHVLALRSDGTVVAWGDNAYGQTNVPAGLSNVVSVSAGWLFSMALQANGRVVTWGNFQSITPPPTLTNGAAISAGGHQFCLALLSNSTVVAWGYNGSGQTNVPAGLTNVIGVAAGLDHGAALRRDGTVIVWGSGVFDETNVPPNLTNAIAISSGWAQTLALRPDGTVIGWGMDANVPAGLSNVVAMVGGWDAGQNFLRRDGSMYFGPTNVIAIARGHFFAVAVTMSTNAPQALTKRCLTSSYSPGKFTTSTGTRWGRVYALEYKTNLNSSTWAVAPLVSGSGQVQTVSDDGATGSQRFYRVVEW